MNLIATVFVLAAAVSTVYAPSSSANPADRAQCSAATRQLQEFQRLTKVAQKAYYAYPTEQNLNFRIAIGVRVKAELIKVNEACLTDLKPSEAEADFR